MTGADGPVVPRPPAGTVEAWCLALIETEVLDAKLAPEAIEVGRTHQWAVESSSARAVGPKTGGDAEWTGDRPGCRIERPGRPPELDVHSRSPRKPRPGAYADPRTRALLLHTFAHHELQAAELFAWAILAFPRTPTRFRRGLLAILLEELRHLRLYVERIEALGARFGDWPVRDWFWQRVPLVETPLGFVSLMGLGLEAANLDHAASFARRFRAVGDHESAARIDEVERDEVRHVAFARRWFTRWRAEPTVEAFAEELPEPLTPALFQGRPLNVAARTRAGLGADFLAGLARWEGATRSARPRRGTAGGEEAS